MNLDKAFGIHEQAMLLRGHRAQILASNLANTDTPQYKARDIDFQSALKQAARRTDAGDFPGMLTTHPGHINLDSFSGIHAELKYRVPMQPSLDGNTVDSQIEKTKFTENALAYQTSLTFLSGRIRGLMTAIRGE